MLLVVRVLLLVQVPQAVGLVHERLPCFLVQSLPPFSKLLRDLRVVDIWVQLDDLLPLNVGEHHERVHRPLDVVRGVLFRLCSFPSEMTRSIFHKFPATQPRLRSITW